MIPPTLSWELQSRGYDALSCHDAGLANQAVPDHTQLAYAAVQERALLTFNTQDFVRLDSEWKAVGRRHAGIVTVARPVEIGHLIRCVMRHLDTVPFEVQTDVLLWLDTSLPC
jgi:hypothetical protein